MNRVPSDEVGTSQTEGHLGSPRANIVRNHNFTLNSSDFMTKSAKEEVKIETVFHHFPHQKQHA